MRLVFLYFLLFTLCESHSPISAQVNIPNANFEILENGSSTGTAVWKTEGSLEQCVPETANAFEGTYSMHVTKQSQQGTGRFYQEIPFQVSAIKKYRISAAIRVEHVTDGYAGVSVRVLDTAGRLVCHQNLNMMPAKINQTQEWKIYEGDFYALPGTAKLKIAGYLWGAGEAWYDRLRIEEIPFGTEVLDPLVSSYIDEYFAIIEKKSIVKDAEYNTRLKEYAVLLCKGNPDMHYCHFVLKNITFNLNDGHSFFSTPEEWNTMQNGSKNLEHGDAGFSTGKMIDDRIAYLHIPTFASLDWKLVKENAVNLQRIIRELDRQKPKGWIIDLSDCSGGNSFAMFPGLGPLLGNGVCGYSVSADGTRMTLIYHKGLAGWDQNLDTLTDQPYVVRKPGLPVAVILGSKTGSSGEVTALTFRGKKNSKSFGQETGGYTTRIDNFRMSDGASINLASGYDADRNGVVFYGTKIPPDVPAKDHSEAIKKAIDWILNY